MNLLNQDQAHTTVLVQSFMQQTQSQMKYEGSTPVWQVGELRPTAGHKIPSFVDWKSDAMLCM